MDSLLPVPRRASLGRKRHPVAGVVTARAHDLPAQGYRLRVTGDGDAIIEAADTAGEFYARQTLNQLAEPDGTVGECEITDWPDLAVRGVMLDVSRDKVPTMATLLALVDRLAGWKINEVQLYTEHTFAYAGHEDVWRDASPFTPDEITDLDAFCAARHITLTANQNCLGHMERWLRFPRYRELALSPEPFTIAGVMRRPPMTMDPSNPRSLALTRDLLGQLLPHFRHSDRVNVGLDEPFELDPARYDEYVAYLAALRAAPELDGREMLVWGDILTGHPELIAHIPDGVTIAEWGYEATHPFDDRVGALAAAGRSAWVCAGTSSWSSLFGRTTNMRENHVAAAEAAGRHGASGYLNTDWGDGGHLQYLPASEPGLAMGAAVSWCLETNREVDFALDEATGALVALGDLHRVAARQTPNMASYLLPLWLPHLRRGFVSDDELEEIDAGLAAGAAAIESAALDRNDGDLVRAEIANSIELARVMIDDGRARNGGTGTLGDIGHHERGRMADRLDAIAGAHRSLWLRRNRPGGLSDSVSWLERLAASYRSGDVDADWLPSGLRPVSGDVAAD